MKMDMYSKVHPLACSESEDYSAALCYPNCKPGLVGAGPLCMSSECKGFYTYSCKLHALCVEIVAVVTTMYPGVGIVVGVAMGALCESSPLMCTQDYDQCRDINMELALAGGSTIVGLATLLLTAGILALLFLIRINVPHKKGILPQLDNFVHK